MAGSVVALPASLTVKRLSKRCGELQAMLIGLILMCCSLVAMTNESTMFWRENGRQQLDSYPDPHSHAQGNASWVLPGNQTSSSVVVPPWEQMSLALLVFYWGYAIAQSLVYSILFKWLYHCDAKPGAFIGWMSACGSVARAVGPVWTTMLYADDASGRTVFFVNAGMIFMGAAALLLSWRRLRGVFV